MSSLTIFFLTLLAIWAVMFVGILISACRQTYKEEMHIASYYIRHCFVNEKSYANALRHLSRLYNIPFRNRKDTDELFRVFVKRFADIIPWSEIRPVKIKKNIQNLVRKNTENEPYYSNSYKITIK